MYDRPHEIERADDDSQDNFAFHPKNIYLMLLLFSLSMLFLALTAAFVYTRIQSDLPPLKLPLLFLANTVILLGSSYTMVSAKRAYLADDTDRYQRMLWYTLFLSLFFMVMQALAWYQLFSQQIYVYSDNSAGYLYVISALHFAHVIGGLPFLAVFLHRARKYMREPVSVLVYFSDPDKRLNLRLLTIYWHFLDALWIYLVVFFLINQLLWEIL
ncbi:cytochrome c oxidase subunit 3 [Lewinella marina]|uniref:Cytochrome c oxidase subunit III n=1 Tax=Neolewinella marina TaxID=438751 RepID=A0A2G0CJ90_9BACT|nr:cytochrome c oxidase subunit 3 [Neolewinella marina]NJB84808.1 cytochrome c oxidase subunit 3 [Neolewinella marina]PHL00035.1 cytochrome c oxidase subunit III [Neolewinella marina]